MINIENNGIAKFSIKSEHATLRAIKLNTSTDSHDTLVEESVKHLFRGAVEETEGHIFILNDVSNEIATVFIVSAPDCVMPTFKVKDMSVEIKTSGYPISVGYAEKNKAEKLCRDWYRMHYRPYALHSMSNTWGDRNGRSRVNDEFIRREIDSAADLGLDVVQIDDGWQKGIPETYDGNGLRVFEGDFWDLKDDIFPKGMRTLSDYAKEKGTKLGLWFAPHSRERFEYFERDIKVLKDAFTNWDIKYFKLDMLQLQTVEQCSVMLDFLDEIFSFGEGVSVELDVTADKRLGYLLSAPYGTIFVENRYTAWANYYPHRTLRNLWSLSRFIPASKFQFELVNPELYTDKYSSTDEFRPELYDIDYLFASVMFSNPLFWMETQFLSEKCRAKLKDIISIWRKHRDELVVADVSPIGEAPNGRSMTGFVADLGSYTYVLVFREATERDTYSYECGSDFSSAELIASNTDISFSVNNGRLSVTFGKMRSYAWLLLK